MRKLRVCFVNHEYEFIRTGAGTYATSLVNTVADDGHEVTVICPEESGRESHDLVEVFTVPRLKWDPSHGRGWFSLSYKFARKLKLLRKERDFDIIHFTNGPDALFYTDRSRPLVGTMHDYYFATASKNPIYYKRYYSDWLKRYIYYQCVRMLERAGLSRLDAVITNSRFLSGVLENAYKLPRKKIQSIYYGIDAGRFSKGGEKHLESTSPIILFCGGNFQRKGLPTVVRALPKIINRFPHIKVYVIGKSRGEEKIRSLALRCGVGSHLKFLGFVDSKEISRYYRLADIYVMPSLIEGFGYVFLEAMASEVPVIGGDVEGTRELISDGVNGFLVKPGAHGQLAERVLEVLCNEELRMRLIRAGKETVAKFTIRRMVDNTYQVYQKLL